MPWSSQNHFLVFKSRELSLNIMNCVVISFQLSFSSHSPSCESMPSTLAMAAAFSASMRLMSSRTAARSTGLLFRERVHVAWDVQVPAVDAAAPPTGRHRRPGYFRSLFLNEVDSIMSRTSFTNLPRKLQSAVNAVLLRSPISSSSIRPFSGGQ